MRVRQDSCNLQTRHIYLTFLIPHWSLPCDFDRNIQFTIISCLLLVCRNHIKYFLPKCSALKVPPSSTILWFCIRNTQGNENKKVPLHLATQRVSGRTVYLRRRWIGKLPNMKTSLREQINSLSAFCYNADIHQCLLGISNIHRLSLLRKMKPTVSLVGKTQRH